jgi:hypothetical protein
MKSMPPKLPTIGNTYWSQPAAPAGWESMRGGADNVIGESGTRGGAARGARRTVRDRGSTVTIDSSH